ncbi:hypothetical protein NSERUTF1_1686 [Nocardia seriolae]|nr:hypothetical protein NSERUTF1_1686 [Nocardia seriolae]
MASRVRSRCFTAFSPFYELNEPEEMPPRIEQIALKMNPIAEPLGRMLM